MSKSKELSLGELLDKLRKNPTAFAEFIHELAHELTPDEIAHVHEHSLEVNKPKRVTIEVKYER